MANKKFEICIVDDGLPFFEETDDSQLVPSNLLLRIIHPEINWLEERNLLHLTTLLLESDYFKKGKIEINWAASPNILVNAIKNDKYSPNLVIYDWEYRSSFVVPEEPLFELISLLKRTFFFIYSAYAPKIPIHLYKVHLDKYANRFQILAKGDTSYVITAEEIVYDYVAILLEKNPDIKIGGLNVHFTSGGFLKEYKDIFYLDSLVGRETILSNLKEKNILSTVTIVKMLNELNLRIYSNNSKNIMTLDNTDRNNKLFGKLEEISNSAAYQKLGLKQLKVLVETGTIKI